MARLRTIEKRNNPQATELSQLIEELRRVSELECPESELAEALEQQTRHQRVPVGNRELATDVQLALDAGTDSAARLCNATNALIARIGRTFTISSQKSKNEVPEFEFGRQSQALRSPLTNPR